MRVKSYLKENWGAPFIVGFILLLIASAVELGVGLSNVANSIAVYAFYLLVAGVVLQIASYIKYGGEKPEVGEVRPEPVRPRGPWSRRRKILAVAITLVIVVASASVVFVYSSSIGPVLPHQTNLRLTVSVSYVGYSNESKGLTAEAFVVYVDGASHVLENASALVLTLLPGNHTISAANFGVAYDPSGCPSLEYSFSSWSIGGRQNQTIDIKSDMTLTATYAFYKQICPAPSQTTTTTATSTTTVTSTTTLSISSTTSGSGTSTSTAPTTYVLTLGVYPAPNAGYFELYVDGVAYHFGASNGTTISILLTAGSHEVDAVSFGSVADPSGCPSTVYQFSSWSDGGSQDHTISLVDNMALTATYSFYRQIC